MEDVGRVREQVRPQVFAHVGAGQLREVLDDLILRVAPREVRVRLRESRLREMAHHFRARERFREENDVRIAGVHLRDHPFPEAERLGVRIVDAEDANAAIDPEERDVEQRPPERSPVLGLEVERIDVLVLLRWILGVLDRPIGPMAEPFRMLANPGMVRRALPGEIERDLETQALRLAAKRLEVLHRAQTRLDGGVPARFGADGPRAARVGGRRHQAVVASLAKALADRMNRRKVDHVEAEVGDVGQMRGGVAKRSAAIGCTTGRPREHLVPRAEARALTIGPHAQRGGHGRARAVRVRVHPRAELVAERGLDAPAHRRRLAQRVGLRQKPSRVIFYGAWGPIG